MYPGIFVKESSWIVIWSDWCQTVDLPILFADYYKIFDASVILLCEARQVAFSISFPSPLVNQGFRKSVSIAKWDKSHKGNKYTKPSYLRYHSSWRLLWKQFEHKTRFFFRICVIIGPKLWSQVWYWAVMCDEIFCAANEEKLPTLWKEKSGYLL